VLAGSPERVAEKILDWHEAFGHEFQSISLSPEADFEEQKDTLRRFAEEVVPLVRAEVKSTLWGPLDTRRAKGFTAV
ncbi:LLM class flavin-dependent oxidoreductase, partial [Mycobacterium kansasii]